MTGKPTPNPASLLHERGAIGITEMAILHLIAAWLDRVRRSLRFPPDVAPWPLIAAGQVPPPRHRDRRTAGDIALWHLMQIRDAFAQAHRPDILDRIVAVAEGKNLPASERELAELRIGLDLAADLLAQTRRVRRNGPPLL